MNDIWSRAFFEAREAERMNEVPVGAVIARGGEIIASAHNLCEVNQNPLDHAEVLVIKRVLEHTGAMYLRDCSLYVTLEPCCMCAGAIDLVGIQNVYFAAFDPKMGEVDHNHRVWSNSKIQAFGGFHEEESKQLLKNFFTKLR